MQWLYVTGVASQPRIASRRSSFKIRPNCLEMQAAICAFSLQVRPETAALRLLRAPKGRRHSSEWIPSRYDESCCN